MRDERPRILVVEDDAAIAGALELALCNDGYDVRVEEDADGGEQGAAWFFPDLAILDIRLPNGQDGISLCRRLRRAGDLPVVFLTAADDLDVRLDCFRAGGEDYLPKPFAMAELLLRVHALLRRAGHLAPHAHQVGSLVLDEASHRVVLDEVDVDLTPTEFKLLLALVRCPGQVLSKSQLLEAAWGCDAYDRNLVEVHISSLRRKLEARGQRTVHTVRGIGYVARP